MTETSLVLESNELIAPSRSVLYRLQPIEVTTADRESLGSYFCRLAEAHCITPRQLAAMMVSHKGRGENGYWANIWRLKTFSGCDTVPQTCTLELTKLTAVEGLDRLTMLAVSDVINPIGLMRGRKWCALCIAEQDVNGTPYGKLVWELGVVTACIKHGVVLTKQCICQGKRVEKHRLHPRPMFHLCPCCGRNLAMSSAQQERATAAEISVARLVHEFLESQYFNNPAEGSKFKQFIAEIIERDFQGKAAWLAKFLGVSKSVIHGWYMYGYAPSLQRCVELAMKFSCPIENLFTCTLPERKAVCTDFVPISVGGRKGKLDLAKVEIRLKSELEQPAPVSVRELAREFGVWPKSLYHAFDSLTRQIAQKREGLMTQRRRAELGKLEDLLRYEARRLLDKGMNPTRRTLTKNLGKVAQMFKAEHKALCKRIISEEKARAHNLEGVLAIQKNCSVK